MICFLIVREVALFAESQPENQQCLYGVVYDRVISLAMAVQSNLR